MEWRGPGWTQTKCFGAPHAFRIEFQLLPYRGRKSHSSCHCPPDFLPGLETPGRPKKVLKPFSKPRREEAGGASGGPAHQGHAGVLGAATAILDSGSPPISTVFLFLWRWRGGCARWAEASYTPSPPEPLVVLCWKPTAPVPTWPAST